MTDEQFRSLCNVYGFAPSRSLRELLDTAISQSKRKPLTEEEILSLFRVAGSPVEFARAIERAHGIT